MILCFFELQYSAALRCDILKRFCQHFEEFRDFVAFLKFSN